ncbi:MAG: Rod shape-determining protein MreD [Bacteroidia bacterium]|nr:Rod shape-determining protein MreD [Bacteroidia bacterium]
MGFFFVYVITQIFFAKDLELFGLAFCFIYVNYLLTLPLNTGRASLLLLAFVMGILVDSFYDTLGIHTAASVLVAYVRPHLIAFMTGKDEINELSVKETGWQWFIGYCVILVFSHHLLIFLLQQFNFMRLPHTFLKAVASTLFTLFFVMIIQYLFYSPQTSHARK